MTDRPIKPTDAAYKKAEEIWRSASTIVSCCRQVLEYGVREGADHELQACCEWLRGRGLLTSASDLEKVRRPSVKTRALVALEEAVLRGENFTSSDATKVIRQALESIDD